MWGSSRIIAVLSTSLGVVIVGHTQLIFSLKGFQCFICLLKTHSPFELYFLSFAVDLRTIVDTADYSSLSFTSDSDDRAPEVAIKLHANVSSRSNDVSAKKLSNASVTATLCAFEENQKVVSANAMQLTSNNVESGFVSCSSSDSNLNEDTAVSTVKTGSMRTSSQSSDYVNFSNSKSFLKVDLKSAIYSRGYLSIWVKITYRIYEKISDTDWIGLYYIGKCSQSCICPDWTEKSKIGTECRDFWLKRRHCFRRM